MDINTITNITDGFKNINMMKLKINNYYINTKNSTKNVKKTILSNSPYYRL